jgi:hypothetical protein
VFTSCLDRHRVGWRVTLERFALLSNGGRPGFIFRQVRSACNWYCVRHQDS